MTDERHFVHVDPEIADLVPQYLTSRREDVITLRSLLGSDDFEAIRRIAHQIKGSGSSYGFDELTSTGRALEAAARASDAGGAASIIERLDSYLRTVIVVSE